jgi:hypothetical protein
MQNSAFTHPRSITTSDLSKQETSQTENKASFLTIFIRKGEDQEHQYAETVLTIQFPRYFARKTVTHQIDALFINQGNS